MDQPRTKIFLAGGFLALLILMVGLTVMGGAVLSALYGDIDAGIGIADKDIPKIMAPFTQVAGSLSRNHDGTGLGLPICKSLLDLHNADLNITSEVGKGSIVTVSFPPERTVQKT